MSTLRTELLNALKAEVKPIPETKSLMKRFGTLTAVDGFSPSVQPGEMFGLDGPNTGNKRFIQECLSVAIPKIARRLAGNLENSFIAKGPNVTVSEQNRNSNKDQILSDQVLTSSRW